MPAKMLIGIGALLIVAGVVLMYAPWAISWFGRLPGDIRIKGERTFLFVPVVSMLVVSVLLTLIVNLAARLFR